jgi:hypothetical protein
MTELDSDAGLGPRNDGADILLHLLLAPIAANEQHLRI